MSAPPGDLPYSDTKPQGSADFYFAINATFRFIRQRLGLDGWRRYLEDLGRSYYAPANRQWRDGGLPAVARYWRAFFAAEPGGSVEVAELPDRVEVRVAVCPALTHLRAGGRVIVREYCQHCYHVGRVRAEEAGLTMRLAGGNGSCRHTFATAAAGLPPQDAGAIAEVTS
jgi:hypothetical protein